MFLLYPWAYRSAPSSLCVWFCLKTLCEVPRQCCMFRDVVLKSHTAPFVQDVTPARGDLCAVAARELQKQSHTLVVYCTDAKALVSQCCYTYTYFEVHVLDHFHSYAMWGGGGCRAVLYMTGRCFWISLSAAVRVLCIFVSFMMWFSTRRGEVFHGDSLFMLFVFTRASLPSAASPLQTSSDFICNPLGFVLKTCFGLVCFNPVCFGLVFYPGFLPRCNMCQAEK